MKDTRQLVQELKEKGYITDQEAITLRNNVITNRFSANIAINLISQLFERIEKLEDKKEKKIKKEIKEDDKIGT